MTRLGLSLNGIFALTDEELTTLVTAVGTANKAVQFLGEELMGDLDYVRVFSTPANIKDDAKVARAVDTWLRDAVVPGDEKRGYARKKNAYVIRPSDWEVEIAQNSIGEDRAWQIQVILPDPKAYQPAASATTLLTKDVVTGKYKQESFYEKSRVVKNIVERLNLQRQTINVLCPAKLPPGERDQIRHAAQAVFT